MNGVYTFSFLKAQDTPALYEAFQQAFEDYIIPIKVSREDFAIKFKREGIEPTFCAGAFQGGKLVGFVITGLGEWQGKPAAYNAGTGVLPEHRGHRLTQRLYEFMLPKLRESGIELCLLEVIEQNAPAVKAYKAIGFEMTRVLDCFRSPKQHLLLSEETPRHITVRKVTKPNWAAYAEFCDISPSWQNSRHAFIRSPDQKLVLEAYSEDSLLVGYSALFPRTGAIAQMAVQQSYRNRGVATALLKEMVRQSEADALLVTNVDASCQNLVEFLERSHFSKFLVQQEMRLAL
jgi:ribosomal protein S18 acetylase RimI-like enzyme